MSWIASSLSWGLHGSGQVTFLAGIPHGIGPRFLSRRSNSPPVIQQTSFPWDLALVAFASGLGRWTYLLPSIPPQWHVGTDCAGLWGSEAPWCPTWGIHQGIIQHQAGAQSVWWMPMFPSPPPSSLGLLHFAPIMQLQVVYGNQSNKIITHWWLSQSNITGLLAVHKTELPMGYNFTHSVLYNNLQNHTILWSG